MCHSGLQEDFFGVEKMKNYLLNDLLLVRDQTEALTVDGIGLCVAEEDLQRRD